MQIKQLKPIVLISFLGILIPGPHVSIPLALLLPFLLLQSIWELFTTTFSGRILSDVFVSLCLCTSLLFMLLRNKWLLIVAVVVQISWLAYTFKSNYPTYWYYSIPVAVYYSSALFLLVKTIKNHFKTGYLSKVRKS